MYDKLHKISLMLLCLAVVFVMPQRLALAQTEDAVAAAQSKLELAKELLVLDASLQEYNNIIQEFALRVTTEDEEGITRLDNELKALDIRWGLFYQENQKTLVESEPLFARTNDYLNGRDQLREDMVKAHQRIENRKVVEDAQQYFAQKLPEFKELESKAFKLSLTKQTAKALEKVKAKEQVMSADVESHYQQACAAAGDDPEFAEQKQSIEEACVEIHNCAANIQQSEFKPLIQRIKDYLMGFACVAVLLMFVSMVKSKIKAAKQMRETLKKAKEQYMQNDDSIPSI